jgi:hypothetical protein
MKINRRQSYDAIPIQDTENITTSVKKTNLEIMTLIYLNGDFTHTSNFIRAIDIGIIITLFLLNSVYS